MKKVILMLVLFAFISVIPSFAMKVILNNPNDRTVPSRSSGFSDYNDDTEYNETQTVRKYKKIYPDESLYILSRGIRGELVGTTWGYFKDYPQPYAGKQKSQKELKMMLLKRSSREAADYYMQDTINNPQNLVQSGFIPTSNIR